MHRGAWETSITALWLCVCLLTNLRVVCLADGTVEEAPSTELTVAELCETLLDPATGAYLPYGGEAWGTLLKDSAYAAQALPEDVITVSNHTGVTPPIELLITDAGNIIMTLSYDYYEEAGLFAANARAIFLASDDDTVKAALSAFMCGAAASFGTEDVAGTVVQMDFTDADINELNFGYVWFGDNDTFLRLQLMPFRDMLILDIDTGLTTYFPALTAKE